MTGLRSAVSCYDKIFDKASSNTYNLSIRLRPDGLFFTIYNTENSKYIGFESNLLSGVPDIYNFISKHPWLGGHFRNTVCILPSSKYTIIPQALFIDANAAKYLSFVHEVHPSEEIAVSRLKSTDATVVFACELGYFELVRECFPRATILPTVTAVVDLMLPIFRNSPGNVMCIHLNKNDFDLLIIRDGNMVYCNNFSYSNADDLVYYTIFVIDQLKLNAEKVKTYLSGEISQKSDLIRLLKKYIRSVNVYNPDMQAQLSYALHDVNPCNYPDLFNPRLCEL